jgi:hypothetical protein
MKKIILLLMLILSGIAFASDQLPGWNQVNDEIFGTYYIHPKFQTIKDKSGSVVEIKYSLKDLSKQDVMEQRGWVLVDCAKQAYSIKFGWLEYKTPFHDITPDFWAYKDLKKYCSKS